MALPVVCRSVRNISKFLQNGFLGTATLDHQQVREVNSKHKDPKFRELRRRKVVEPQLQLRVQDRDKKLEYKNEYLYTPPYIKNLRYWEERDVYTSTSNIIIDQKFVPPEDDPSSKIGKIVSFESLTDTGKDKLALRKIRSYEDFRKSEWLEEVKDIYIKAHECLVKGDKDGLVEYVTVAAIREMLSNMHLKTVRWKYLQALEEPKILSVRAGATEGKQTFAQIIVRFHSQQQLAIYDRFGRLQYGSETLAKDVLEYIVFEKDLTNLYGKWRIHKKIQPKNSAIGHGRTFRAPEDQEEPPLADASGAVDPENMVEMTNARRTRTEWTTGK